MSPDDLLGLLVPATQELLDDWCGPVLVDGLPSIANLGEALWRGPSQGEPRWWYWKNPDRVELDLRFAECRDRVRRVVASVLFRDVPANGDGFTWRCEGFCWELKAHNLNWRAGFATDTSSWFARDEGNRTGRFPSRSVPALADLNPSDDTRLSDGSRLVDALALAAVARDVLMPRSPR